MTMTMKLASSLPSTGLRLRRGSSSSAVRLRGSSSSAAATVLLPLLLLLLQKNLLLPGTDALCLNFCPEGFAVDLTNDETYAYTPTSGPNDGVEVTGTCLAIAAAVLSEDDCTNYAANNNNDLFYDECCTDTSHTGGCLNVCPVGSTLDGTNTNEYTYTIGSGPIGGEEVTGTCIVLAYAVVLETAGCDNFYNSGLLEVCCVDDETTEPVEPEPSTCNLCPAGQTVNASEDEYTYVYSDGTTSITGKCLVLAYNVAVTETDCDHYDTNNLHDECCYIDDSFVSNCPSCYDGSDIDDAFLNDVVEELPGQGLGGNLTCGQLQETTGSGLLSDEFCTYYQNLAYEYCGCLTSPPGCTLCHDGSPVDNDLKTNVIDPYGLSCGFVETFEGFLCGESDVAHALGHVYCGCPAPPPASSDPSCTLCPDGSAPSDPTKITEFNNFNCQTLHVLAGTMFDNDEDCAAAQAVVSPYCCDTPRSPSCHIECSDVEASFDINNLEENGEAIESLNLDFMDDAVDDCFELALALEADDATCSAYVGQASSLCCTTKSLTDDVCSPCADGSSIPVEYQNATATVPSGENGATTELICGQLAYATRFATDDCNIIHSITYEYCGCPTGPEICPLCYDGAPIDEEKKDTVIPPIGETCEVVDGYASTGAWCDDEGVPDVFFQVLGYHYCGCPALPPAVSDCTVCPDGTLDEPDKMTELDGLDCKTINTLASRYFPDEQCFAAQAVVSQYCCESPAVPTCPVQCPDGQTFDINIDGDDWGIPDIGDCFEMALAMESSADNCDALSDDATMHCCAADSSTCYLDPTSEISDCTCHPSCATCGYSTNPVADSDCITCADGHPVTPVHGDGTGTCDGSGADANVTTTESPTMVPSSAPSSSDTMVPSSKPSALNAPTGVPTKAPTSAPVADPTSGAAFAGCVVALVATVVTLLVGPLYQ